jgi:uncharacterized membrane protein YqiK
MSTSSIITILILLAIVLIVLFFIFYKRASKEVAFVRTGFGGEKVVKSGGAIVIPRLHEVVKVYMNTLRLEVQRIHEQSVITKDRMRVDVVADFYVHVAPDLNAISVAASTLGPRTKNAADLREIVEGKFVDAIRSTAAEMAMEDLHEQRKTFIDKVRGVVAESLSRNGLELEAASLTQLDQTDMSYFNPSNAFDAEGLTRLTEKIESRKKTRNDIEQDTQVQIREKNLETERRNLAIEREEHYARLEQQLEVESRKAEQMAEVARQRAKQSQEADQAEILAKQKVEIAKIISEREIEEERLARERAVKDREIEKEKFLKLAEQAREVEISSGAKQTFQAKAEAEAVRAELVAAEQRVVTAQTLAAAEGRKAIELVEAAREAERKALEMKIMAEAEKAAAADRTDAMKIEAEGQKIRYKVEAEGTMAVNEARNILTPEQIAADLKRYLIEHAPEILRETVKPMEKIDSIKIVQADGLWGERGGGGGSDGIFDSALRFKARAPFIDSLLRELGLEVTSLEGALPKAGSSVKKKDDDK